MTTELKSLEVDEDEEPVPNAKILFCVAEDTSSSSTTGCSVQTASGAITNVTRLTIFQLQKKSRPTERSTSRCTGWWELLLRKEIDTSQRERKMMQVESANIQKGSYDLNGRVRNQTLCRPVRFILASSFCLGRSQHQLRARSAPILPLLHDELFTSNAESAAYQSTPASIDVPTGNLAQVLHRRQHSDCHCASKLMNSDQLEVDESNAELLRLRWRLLSRI
jgi:hypothetical protein